MSTTKKQIRKQKAIRREADSYKLKLELSLDENHTLSEIISISYDAYTKGVKMAEIGLVDEESAAYMSKRLEILNVLIAKMNNALDTQIPKHLIWGDRPVDPGTILSNTDKSILH